MKKSASYSRQRIVDEFTDLPVSRQRKHMLRKVKAGICAICTEKIFKKGRCHTHYLAELDRAFFAYRDKVGRPVRPTKSKYQHPAVTA